MALRSPLAFALACVLAGIVSSSAMGEDALVLAREHYAAGRAAYDGGQYDEALRRFEAGYALAPRPQFLINLGQTYRKLGKPRLARYMFQKFMAASAEDDPQRPSVTSLIDEIDIELSTQSRPPPDAAIARPPVLLIPPSVERSPPARPPHPPGRGAFAPRAAVLGAAPAPARAAAALSRPVVRRRRARHVRVGEHRDCGRGLSRRL